MPGITASHRRKFTMFGKNCPLITISLCRYYMTTAADDLAIVYKDGGILSFIVTRFRTPCQKSGGENAVLECTMKFGSWVYNNQQLDLQRLFPDNNEADLSNYELNPTWEILNATVVQNVNTYECCPEGYTDITYTFKFREIQDL
ncbi:acetylcholine-binding protein-like [Gigantopelta aegis]|uniref:acetylcholine-binding protein-like n=1 Tax=Gigantopelta aegis TaxID=1735272 RepID=UPI001B887B82|nr:acetylcholine-binding protein-like [Gigantopelta aegis]